MMMRSGWSRARTFLATLSVPFRGLQVITGAFPSGRNRSGEDDRDSSPHSAIERTEQLDGKEADANTHGISGKAVTPYLLQRIFELTEGRSLTANIALVRNNARFASKIAAALMSKDA